MKKNFSRIICLLMAVLLLFSLAACSNSSDSQSNQNGQKTESKAEQGTGQKEVTLKLWHIWAADSESNKAPFEKVLSDFQKEYPNIKLEVDAIENETYKTKIKTAVAANEMPDIFFYWGGGMLKSFVDAGKVLPLDEYLDDGTKDRIIPGTLVNYTYDGKVYGLPYTLASGVFFINKEMFEQNNIKIPETYDELVEAVKAFRAKGITPMTVGAKDRWPLAMYFDIMAIRCAGYQACYDALTKKGTFEDPGIIEAARKLQELVQLSAFNEGALGLSRDESEVPFYEGKIPMYFNGNWTAGNIQAENSKIKDKVIAISFPVIEGGKGSINDLTGGAVDTFCVSANTQYKEEAVEALKYICENHSREAYLAGAGMPTWKFDVDESKIDPLALQIAKLNENAETFTLWWNTLLEGNDSENYMDRLVELFAGTLTPEEFARELQKMNQSK